MNTWNLVVERNKAPIATKAGQLTGDKFRKLVSDPTGVLAKVNMAVSESMQYGELKVSASVTLTCDQNESVINDAAQLAFEKSIELMRDGFSYYGVPAGPSKE